MFHELKEVKYFNPIQDGHFWGCLRMGGEGKKTPLP